MTTGGTETSTYDARGLKQDYRNPSNASGYPTARYRYDGLDRVWGVTDALGSSINDANHTTSFAYNLRGQMTVKTSPVDPIDSVRHTIVNTYNTNGDGTLVAVTDQLSHTTNYTYDDYRRPLTVTTPGHNTPVTAYSYYDANGTGNDYTHTDSNVTHLVTPSGNLITTGYDPNYRKLAVIATGAGGGDRAETTYGYDNAGNLTSVVAPNEQPGQIYQNTSTITVYDQRNRPSSIKDALLNTTTFTYDTAGRKKTVTRANGQVITYDSFDTMNRVLQQTATQTPEPAAVTKYTYYTSGLLQTMQDPHLVAINSTDTYNYTYDQTGRKTIVLYPAESGGPHRVNYFAYDTVGRLYTFQNRSAAVQTFSYDALNRMTGFSWNDGLTPSVTCGYDVVCRLTTITNANATISRTYFNDNLLHSETETITITGGVARPVTYTYDADGNRATLQNPGYSGTYSYTGRDQLKSIVDDATGVTASYSYDLSGNLIQRNPGNSTSSSYSYDALDRVTNVTHSLAGGDTRTLDYDYDSVGNRKWTKRDNGNGDVFGYDLSDQVTATKLNIANPDITGVGPQTISYDANGNRTSFAPYGTTDTYYTNNLNEYSQRNSTTATYNINGDIVTGLDGSTYTYDAQNRLLTATKNGTTETFQYDGLNRQVTRTVASVTTYNAYDGWNLIQEYHAGGAVTVSYFHGAGGLVRNIGTGGINHYYYQDASGSTSHLADSTGHLLEWYRYDLQGTPVVYNGSDVFQPGGSNFGVRHLFTGQQWMSEIGLYDLRNRYYSPDIGRFLQADPSGFGGDATNLYRYCGNNPLKASDPTGLDVITMAHPQDWAHGSWGVTDPLSSSRFTWFDFAPFNNPPHAWNTVPGGWKVNDGTSSGISSTTAYPPLTPEQDLVALSALIDASQVSGQTYNFFTHNCWQAGFRVLDAVLIGPGGLINPLDPNTGNIYNAQGNWVGWENPDTGNIYDAEGDWASWNRNWDSNNSGGDFGFVSVSGGSFDTGGGWWGSGGTTTYYPQQIGFDVLPGGSVGGFSPGFTATDPLDFGAMDYINARRAARGKPLLYPHGGDLKVIPHR